MIGLECLNRSRGVIVHQNGGKLFQVRSPNLTVSAAVPGPVIPLTMPPNRTERLERGRDAGDCKD